jgi:hypothetical protein
MVLNGGKPPYQIEFIPIKLQMPERSSETAITV